MHCTWPTEYTETFNLREIFKCTHLKFMACGCKSTSKQPHTHTEMQHSLASVGLAQASSNKRYYINVHLQILNVGWTFPGAGITEYIMHNSSTLFSF